MIDIVHEWCKFPDKYANVPIAKKRNVIQGTGALGLLWGFILASCERNTSSTREASLGCHIVCCFLESGEVVPRFDHLFIFSPLNTECPPQLSVTTFGLTLHSEGPVGRDRRSGEGQRHAHAHFARRAVHVSTHVWLHSLRKSFSAIVSNNEITAENTISYNQYYGHSSVHDVFALSELPFLNLKCSVLECQNMFYARITHVTPLS